MPRLLVWLRTSTLIPIATRLLLSCSSSDMLCSRCLRSESSHILFCDGDVSANGVLLYSMILERSRPSIYLPCIMFIWGIVTICMAWVQNYHTLVALRLIVGILESGFAPGILLILSSWYKPNEQSKRFALYISAAILSGM